MSSRRGNSRENRVLELLSEDGWFGLCGRASRGPADILAVRGEHREGKQDPSNYGASVIVVQVKSSAAGPYAHFLPADRAQLLAISVAIRAVPYLAWWPPRRPLMWIPGHDWPTAMRPV